LQIRSSIDALYRRAVHALIGYLHFQHSISGFSVISPSQPPRPSGLRHPLCSVATPVSTGHLPRASLPYTGRFPPSSTRRLPHIGRRRPRPVPTEAPAAPPLSCSPHRTESPPRALDSAIRPPDLLSEAASITSTARAGYRARLDSLRLGSFQLAILAS
jgi:hypothetical protein